MLVSLGAYDVLFGKEHSLPFSDEHNCEYTEDFNGSFMVSLMDFYWYLKMESSGEIRI